MSAQAVQVVAQQATAVRFQTIPDDQQRLLQVGLQRLEEFEDLFLLDAALVQPEHAVGARESGDDRDVSPVEVKLNDGCLSPGHRAGASMCTRFAEPPRRTRLLRRNSCRPAAFAPPAIASWPFLSARCRHAGSAAGRQVAGLNLLDRHAVRNLIQLNLNMIGPHDCSMKKRQPRRNAPPHLLPVMAFSAELWCTAVRPPADRSGSPIRRPCFAARSSRIAPVDKPNQGGGAHRSVRWNQSCRS